jgi:hypothetical protein
LLGADEKIRHIAIDSGHDYNQAMREAMYGWVEKWLRSRGDGRPIPEPEIKVEDVAALRCYPDSVSRPRSIVTIPEFARREGRARLAALAGPPDHRERWIADAELMRVRLRDTLMGGIPAKPPVEYTLVPRPGEREMALVTERGIVSSGRLTAGPPGRTGTVIVLSSASQGRADVPHEEPLSPAKLLAWGGGGAMLELRSPRGTAGELAQLRPVAGVADHSTAEWGLWVGRPLLGQWVYDVVRWLDFLDDPGATRLKKSLGIEGPSRPYALIGLGPIGTAAIIAAALDPRIASVACVGGLVSFVAQSDRPWSGVPMGLLAPNILDVGDIGHIAALVAPRLLHVAGGIEPEGGAATQGRLDQAFAFTRAIYRLTGSADRLIVSSAPGLDAGPR